MMAALNQFYENIDLTTCIFPVRPSGEVKWAYTSLWRTALRPNHNGVDIGSSHYPYYETCFGWQLLAIMEGDLVWRYDDTSGYNANIITPFGTFCYCHMQKPASMASRHVRAGDVIGFIGTSGNVAAHVHFIWFQNGKDRNPVPLLDAIAMYQFTNHTPTPAEDDDMPISDPEWERLANMINGARDEVVAVLETNQKEDLTEETRLRDEMANLLMAVDAANDVEIQRIREEFTKSK